MNALFVRVNCLWIKWFKIELPEEAVNKLKRFPKIVNPFWRLWLPKPIKCPGCGELADKVIAIDTGDGWVFYWDCENECGEGEPITTMPVFCPFVFCWCNSSDLERVGVKVY